MKDQGCRSSLAGDCRLVHSSLLEAGTRGTVNQKRLPRAGRPDGAGRTAPQKPGHGPRKLPGGPGRSQRPLVEGRENPSVGGVRYRPSHSVVKRTAGFFWWSRICQEDPMIARLVWAYLPGIFCPRSAGSNRSKGILPVTSPEIAARMVVANDRPQLPAQLPMRIQCRITRVKNATKRLSCQVSTSGVCARSRTPLWSSGTAAPWEESFLGRPPLNPIEREGEAQHHQPVS